MGFTIDALARFGRLWGILVQTVVPTPREMDEARAVEYMLRIAMRCVISMLLMGLTAMMAALPFVPRLAVSFMALFWLGHLAFTAESVYQQWQIHARKLRRMERAYRRAVRPPDQHI